MAGVSRRPLNTSPNGPPNWRRLAAQPDSAVAAGEAAILHLFAIALRPLRLEISVRRVTGGGPV
jgi:hypothetical protein